MENGPAEERVEEFGTEQQQSSLNVTREDVTGQDIFKLAKRILLFCAIIFVLIATLRATLDESPGISEVWDYSKIVLNSITSLVLGLYFGKRDK